MATQQTPPADTPAATRQPSGQRAAPARDAFDSLTQLQLVKADLEAVSLKLAEIDPDALSEADRGKWEDEVDKVDLAIARARSALLRALSAAFEAELPAIEAATGKLAEDLGRLNKITETIDRVADVLGVIEKVITLGR